MLATLPGAAIGAGVVWIFINVLGGLGTDLFPCPTGYVTGGYVLGIRQAVVSGTLPTMYDWRFILAGIIFAVFFSYVQSKIKVGMFSPVTFAIGMLIPPAYIFPMALGAALDVYLIRKYGKDAETHGKERKKEVDCYNLRAVRR